MRVAALSPVLGLFTVLGLLFVGCDARDRTEEAELEPSPAAEAEPDSAQQGWFRDVGAEWGIDFVHQEEHLDELIDQIHKMERGVQYYRPLGSSA